MFITCPEFSHLPAFPLPTHAMEKTSVRHSSLETCRQKPKVSFLLWRIGTLFRTPGFTGLFLIFPDHNVDPGRAYS